MSERVYHELLRQSEQLTELDVLMLNEITGDWLSVFVISVDDLDLYENGLRRILRNPAKMGA